MKKSGKGKYVKSLAYEKTARMMQADIDPTPGPGQYEAPGTMNDKLVGGGHIHNERRIKKLQSNFVSQTKRAHQIEPTQLTPGAGTYNP